MRILTAGSTTACSWSATRLPLVAFLMWRLAIWRMRTRLIG
jgi:hypothetical protein